MPTISRKTAITTCLSAILFGTAASVFAHTTIQNQISNTSTTYNNVVIGHGCTDASGKTWPIKYQSVLFPTVNPILTEGTETTTESGLKLADIITSSTGIANIPQLILDKNLFKQQSEKTDANGNVIGFNGFNGLLDPSLYGLVPFRTGGITFVEGAKATNGQCIQKLVVKVAIADICKVKTFPPKEGTANLWIPNPTSKFTELLDGMGDGSVRKGSPASLTINNPACTSGQTVTVWPSDQDIDANLVMKGWGSKK